MEGVRWNIELPNADWYRLGDERLDGLIREVEDQDVAAIDTETTGLVVWKDMPLYWSMAWGDNRRVCMPIETTALFKRAFSDKGKRWVLANAKFDMHMLANVGITLAGDCVDTAVMHALLYEEESHKLKDMARNVLGWRWSDFFDTFKRETIPDTALAPKVMRDGSLRYPQRKEELFEMFRRFETEHLDVLVDYASNDAYGTLRLYEKLKLELEGIPLNTLYPEWLETMSHLFFLTEAPFTKVLWQCERNGVHVNKEYLTALGTDMETALAKHQMEMVRLSGNASFNPNSNDQVRDYFLNKEGRKALKMTKGGKSGVKKPCVDKQFLEHYELDSPMAHELVQYSKLEKLLSTYIRNVDEHRDQRGRMHTRFNQDIARTGRLSCVAAWTPLKTPYGPVPIGSVRKGDLVWTHRERWQPILDVFTKGFEHMFDVRFSNGEILTCTTAHLLLQDDTQWVSVGEVVDEYLQRMGGARIESADGPAAVSIEGAAYHRGYLPPVEYNDAQRAARIEVLHARSRAQSTGEAALLVIEDGQQEPHDREDWRAAPQLAGGVRGRLRLSDLPAQRQEAVCSSDSNGGGARPGGDSGDLRRASHRQQHKEQHGGQSGISYQSGSQKHSLFAGKGLPFITVEEVVYRGRLEVHDLTIAEDASYAACGVFSHNSSNPNLQNVPTPDKDKFRLRGAFQPQPGSGNTLIVSDYAALEMRLLACATVTPDNPMGAREMIQIFLDGKDIHMGSAELVYGDLYEERHGFRLTYDFLKQAKKIDGQVKEGKLPESARTEQVALAVYARNAIKTTSFGLNYGMKEKKLARSLHISEDEAKAIIERYLDTYPAIRGFYASAIADAQQTGYSTTLLGRRRVHKAINSYNTMDRWSEERKAVNNNIQGTAADAVRLAMINLSRANLDKKYGCMMLLQIHDELMFECPEETADEAMKEIKQIMEHPFPTDLIVPLDVSIGKGPNWAAAK
jgi:DNA polymerase I-like protein with 3'-5' exonuclease and polymerase domains